MFGNKKDDLSIALLIFELPASSSRTRWSLLYLCSSISTTESWWQVLQELKRAIKKFLKNLIDSFFD